MNIVHLLSRDVIDKQQRHFALISIKVPKADDVKTTLKVTNMLTLTSKQKLTTKDIVFNSLKCSIKAGLTVFCIEPFFTLRCVVCLQTAWTR